MMNSSIHRTHNSSLYIEYNKYGLCNRLYHLFMFLLVSETNNYSLYVYWNSEHSSCNGHFLDCFKDIKNIEFVSKDWIKTHGYKVDKTITTEPTIMSNKTIYETYLSNYSKKK